MLGTKQLRPFRDPPTVGRPIRGLEGPLISALLFAAAILASGCGRAPTNPLAGSTLPPVVDVDDSPAWSPDGRMVAYHRRFPSADGPAGLYVIPSTGGAPRFLLAGGFFWPKDISFSPDGRHITATQNFQIAIIDVGLGSVEFPFYATNGARYPAWSPDGTRIAYAAFGIHLFDIQSGVDTPLLHDGLPVSGGQLVWDPDRGRIIALAGSADGLSMVVKAVTPTGTSVTELDRSAQYEIFDYMVARRLPVSNVFGVVYFENHDGWHFVSEAGSRLTFPRGLRFPEAFSPDGVWMITTHWDPESAAPVLFVGRVDDELGGTYRRLTKWSPPAPVAAGGQFEKAHQIDW